jgi:tetratricopeptide (TPR) repeat protein
MDEPGALSSEQFATKQLLAADYAAAQSDFASAAAHLNQLLAIQPDNIAARTRIGDLQRASQQLPEALASYESALATYFTVQSANQHAEPPGALLRKRRQLLTQLVFPAPRHYLPLQAVVVGPNTIALRWAAEMGRHYDIESSVNLQTWAPLQADLVATNTTQSWIVPATGQKRFFRVIASNPGP